jgi:ABC-type multidrug transport system fused ATPase/permease subunit
MASIKEKIRFLRRRRSDRLLNRPIWPEKEDLDYLFAFFLKQKVLLIAGLLFLILQALLEIALIVISHRYLKSSHFALNNNLLFLLIVVIASAYLLMAFLAIKKERELVIRLINDVRSRWFRLFLHKRSSEYDIEQKSFFIAKISYHLPLLSTGVSNSLVGFVRWLLFVGVIIFIAFIFSYKLLWFAFGALLLSIGLGILAAFISHHYITRETTFYSHIIRLMDFNLSDWKFVKKFHQERQVGKKFDELVELDTYFRVRRDLWLRFSVSLVFVLLVFFSFFGSSLANQIEYFFGTASFETRFIMIIALIYFSRLLYESVRVGLYSVPLLLGIKLTIPRLRPRRLGLHKNIRSQFISFSVQKAKLFKQSQKYQSFQFNFQVKGRYLILGSDNSSLNSLAKIFTGEAVYGRRAWIVKQSHNRYFYNEFFDKFGGFFYIDPEFRSSRSLLETVLGKNKDDIKEEEFLILDQLINSYPLLRGIFSEKEDWRLSARHFCINPYNIFLIQALHCFMAKPYLVSIDQAWLSLGDKRIEQLIKLMHELLPKSIILIFANQNNNIIEYDEIYSL